MLNKLYYSCRVLFSRVIHRPLFKYTNQKKVAEKLVNMNDGQAGFLYDQWRGAPKYIFSREISKNNNTVILISHDFFPAGAQINLLHGGKVLKEKFSKRVIFIGLKDGKYRGEFEKVGDEVYSLSPETQERFVITREIEDFFGYLKNRGISQCVCNTVPCGSLAKLLRSLNFNFVNLIHELPVTVRIYSLQEQVDYIKQFSEKIVFSSEYARNCYTSKYGIEHARTLVRGQGCYFSTHYYGKKQEAQSELKKQLSLPEDAVIILTCGHLYYRKGPDVFLDLAKKMLEDIKNQHLYFIWLGGFHHEALSWFEHDKEKMGIGKHVRHVDFVSDPSLFFAGADVFVLTAREDPFPTVVLESMDNGTPVIAFNDTGGIPELLRDNCGVVVPFLDTTAMAKQIIELLDDKEKYEKIVKKSKNRVLQEYDFNKYMEFVLSLFDDEKK